MKPALLFAALCVGALSACSADAADPLAPSFESETSETASAGRGPAAPSAATVEGLEDALDRITMTIDGNAAGRVRVALQRAIAAERSGNAAARTSSIESVRAAVDQLELEGGAAAGAEADAIRLALGTR